MVNQTIGLIWRAYKATSQTSGKSYIGITSQSLARRWGGHIHSAIKKMSTAPFHRAIRKYGASDFLVEEVGLFSCRAHALAAEIRLVAQAKTLTPSGYNGNPGGGMIAATALVWTEARRQKVRLALTGRKIPADIVAKVAAKLRGRKQSPDRIEITRAAGKKNKGRKHTGNQLTNLRVAHHARSLKRSNPNVGCTRCGASWRVRIWRRGVQVPLGRYETIEKAREVWRRAKAALLAEILSGVDNPMFNVDGRRMQAESMRIRWKDAAHREKVRSAKSAHQKALVLPENSTPS